MLYGTTGARFGADVGLTAGAGDTGTGCWGAEGVVVGGPPIARRIMPWASSTVFALTRAACPLAVCAYARAVWVVGCVRSETMRDGGAGRPSGAVGE